MTFAKKREQIIKTIEAGLNCNLNSVAMDTNISTEKYVALKKEYDDTIKYVKRYLK